VLGWIVNPRAGSASEKVRDIRHIVSLSDGQAVSLPGGAPQKMQDPTYPRSSAVFRAGESSGNRRGRVGSSAKAEPFSPDRPGACHPGPPGPGDRGCGAIPGCTPEQIGGPPARTSCAAGEIRPSGHSRYARNPNVAKRCERDMRCPPRACLESPSPSGSGGIGRVSSPPPGRRTRRFPDSGSAVWSDGPFHGRPALEKLPARCASKYRASGPVCFATVLRCRQRRVEVFL